MGKTDSTTKTVLKVGGWADPTPVQSEKKRETKDRLPEKGEK